MRLVILVVAALGGEKLRLPGPNVVLDHVPPGPNEDVKVIEELKQAVGKLEGITCAIMLVLKSRTKMAVTSR